MDKKYLLTTEFRYHTIPATDYHSDINFKEITIGIYDNWDDAERNGNDFISLLNKKYGFSIKDKLGVSYSLRNNLVINWDDKPIHVSVKIQTLDFTNVDDILTDMVKSEKKYEKWRKREM